MLDDHEDEKSQAAPVLNVTAEMLERSVATCIRRNLQASESAADIPTQLDAIRLFLGVGQIQHRGDRYLGFFTTPAEALHDTQPPWQ